MPVGESDFNPYLQQEVLSASPIKLKWLLIKRSEELCGIVAHMWSLGEFSQGNQWLSRIRDILGELLEGVKDATNPVSSTISDFYVFLLQLTFQIEDERDAERLLVLQELLAIEAETWRLVLTRGEPSPIALDPEREKRAMKAKLVPPIPSSMDTLAGGTFSLEV